MGDQALVSNIPFANVSTVPLRSPLRYPGGKTWLIPHIRRWLADPSEMLIEPFAGGTTVSLTAVMEGLAKRSLMVDLDRDVAAFWRAAFWRAALMHGDELVERVLAFSPTHVGIDELEQRVPASSSTGFRHWWSTVSVVGGGGGSHRGPHGYAGARGRQVSRPVGIQKRLQVAFRTSPHTPTISPSARATV